MQTNLLQMACLFLCVFLSFQPSLIYCNVISSNVRAVVLFMWRLSVGKWAQNNRNSTNTQKRQLIKNSSAAIKQQTQQGNMT